MFLVCNAFFFLLRAVDLRFNALFGIVQSPVGIVVNVVSVLGTLHRDPAFYDAT